MSDKIQQHDPERIAREAKKIVEGCATISKELSADMTSVERALMAVAMQGQLFPHLLRMVMFTPSCYQAIGTALARMAVEGKKDGLPTSGGEQLSKFWPAFGLALESALRQVRKEGGPTSLPASCEAWLAACDLERREKGGVAQ